MTKRNQTAQAKTGNSFFSNFFRKSFGIWFFLGLPVLFLSPMLGFAAIQFEVQPSATQIGPGESLTVEFTITTEGEDDDVGEPQYSAPDFEEVNSYSGFVSSQTTIINGKISSSRSVQKAVVLIPKKEGVLAVKNIRIKVGSKTAQAEDLSIEVSAKYSGAGNNGGVGIVGRRGAPLPNRGTNPKQENGAQSVFIRTTPEKEKVYRGEQFLLNYEIFARARLENITIERYPTANNFLKEDIDLPLLRRDLKLTKVIVNGLEYARGVLARYALFALKDGRLSLDQLTARITYGGAGGGASLFDDDDFFNLNSFFRAFQSVTETRQSDKREIEVMPLPVEGQPSGFSGLVGNFEITLSSDKNSLKVGEALQVIITVKGKGHPGSLTSLDMTFPQDFEKYEEKAKTTFRPDGNSEKVYEVLLIPRAPGQFQIQPVTISMFDPEKKQYLSRQSGTLTVQVTGEAMVASANVGSNSGPVNSQAGGVLGAGVESSSRPNLFLSDGKGRDWVSVLESIIVILFCTCALGLSGVLIWRNRKVLGAYFGKKWAAKQSQPTPEVKLISVLRIIHQKAETEKTAVLEVCRQADAAIYEYLERRLGVSCRSLSWGEIDQVWQDKALSPELLSTVKEFSQRLDQMRYQGSSTKYEGADWTNLADLISRLEKYTNS